MSISVGTRVFSISILAIPIINLFDKFINYFKITETFTIVSSMLAILFMIMALLIISTRSLLQRYNCQQYPFYVFSLLCFNSVCCIIIGLELEGLISGFCSTLLKNGDVHLRSAFGAMIFHLNGILVYAISVTIIAAITWNNEFHDTLCYWLGSWYNIVIVFLLGILTGKTGPNWSTLLYLPYIVLPIHMSRNLLGKNDQSQPPIINSSIWRRHIDLSLVIFFIFASFMAIFRGIIVLDSPLEPCKWYTRRVEPYLLSTTPAPFAKIQMLLIMFTFTPFYLASIYHLINGTFYKMSESSLIYAGASLSAQVTHFGASVHSRTPYVFRVPSDWDSQAIFWVFNLVLMVGPQIFALRCLQPEDFSSEENANKPFDETVKINGDTPKDK